MIEAVIYDFDGVIADSFNVFVESLGEVLHRPQPLTSEEIADLRGSSTREIIKKLEVKKWQMPSLMVKGRRSIASKMDSVQIFDGMPEAITELGQTDRRQYIVSTNSQEAITGLLGRYGLENSMTDIYAGTSLFGKAKRLTALLKKEGLLAENCVYVGDETRDIEAAREVGLRSIAVGWGYSTPAALQSYNSDAVVLAPNDLPSAILSLK